jgi:hypothetical protein
VEVRDEHERQGTAGWGGLDRPTPHQQAWLADLRAAGVAAYCWTPEAWPEIERVLRDGPQ